MEKNEFIMFCLGAGSLFVGMLIYPWIMKVKEWFINLGKTKIVIQENPHYCDDLQEQINNLAERLATRDANRKNNTRREVRDYLAELRDDK